MFILNIIDSKDTNKELLEQISVDPDLNVEAETSTTDERKKILYVSDDHFMQIVVSDLIEKNTIYQIETADNGAEGLEKYYDYKPNLILTDLIMPEIDGIELCRHIKINNRDENTNVIIFSSTADEKIIEKAYSYKAKAYIVKPIKPEKLLRKINRILS